MEKNLGDAEFVFIDGPHDKDDEGGKCWWTMKDGERSFNAIELQGLEQSLQFLESNSNGPYDIALGHSQGAMMLALLLARAITQKPNAMTIVPKVNIFTGAAYPECQSSLLMEARQKIDTNTDAMKFGTIHAIGRADEMNPPASAYKVASVFDLKRPGDDSFTILEHGGGHIFPQDDVAMQAYMEVIEAYCT